MLRNFIAQAATLAVLIPLSMSQMASAATTAHASHAHPTHGRGRTVVLPPGTPISPPILNTRVNMVPFVCDPSSEMISQYENFNNRFVLDIDGTGLDGASPQYPCVNGGGVLTQINGLRQFASIEFDFIGSCNIEYGPAVVIQLSRGPLDSDPIDYVANACGVGGIVTGPGVDGFSHIVLNAADFFGSDGGSTPQIPDPILPTDTIRQVAIACFPNGAGNGSDGPTRIDNVVINQYDSGPRIVIENTTAPQQGCQGFLGTWENQYNPFPKLYGVTVNCSYASSGGASTAGKRSH